MILDRISYLNYLDNHKNYLVLNCEKNNNVIIDKENPNIYYFSTLNGYLYKVDIKNNITDRIEINNNNLYYISNIIGQDEEYIYIISTSYYDSLYNKYFVMKVKKDKFTLSFILNDLKYNKSSIYIEQGSYKDEIYMYHLENNYIHKRVLDLKNNELLNKYSLIPEVSNSTYWEDYLSILNSTKKQNFLYFVTITNNNINIHKYDKKNNKINKMNYIKDNITVKNNIFKEFRVFNIQKNNKDYLVLIVNLPPYYKKSYSNDVYCSDLKCYLFEIQDINLNLVDTYDLSHLGITNVIYQEEKELFMLGSYRNVNLLRINELLEFENVFSSFDKYDAFGIGRDNNIYIQCSDKSIFRLDKGTDVLIKVKFEKEIYKFKGDFIESFIKIDILNYYGENLKKDINLKLIGDFEFLDGSKEKDIITSDISSIQIPIIIKGSSKLDYILKVK